MCTCISPSFNPKILFVLFVNQSFFVVLEDDGDEDDDDEDGYLKLDKIRHALNDIPSPSNKSNLF